MKDWINKKDYDFQKAFYERKEKEHLNNYNNLTLAKLEKILINVLNSRVRDNH